VLYGCKIWSMSPCDKHKVDVAWNNCFRKIFNACWRESVKPLLFILQDYVCLANRGTKKNDFYNKILSSSNIVLRILSALHRNEAQKVSSASNILLGQSRNIDIKRAVWSSFVRLFTI